jgi:hypothetical protein
VFAPLRAIITMVAPDLRKLGRDSAKPARE